MYIKSFLEKHSTADVRIFNFQVKNRPSFSEFEKTLKEFGPDITGITITSLHWYDAHRVAVSTKKMATDSLVVAGGPHIRMYQEETLSHREFDVVVPGEGEITFLELVERVEKGVSLRGLPGISYKTDGEVVNNGTRPVERDPDVFPFPDRSDFDINQHRISIDRFFPSAVILASRGCPYNCAFCQNFDRVYRPRSPEQVVDEVLECRDMGYRSVDFYDDNFTLAREYIVELCRLFIDREVKMPWSCRCRADQVDGDLLQVMARAGCQRMQIGVESASRRVLDQMNKGISLEACVEAFRLAREASISTLAYFILGFPGETAEEAMDTVRFSLKLDPDYAQFVLLIPAPGTPVYEEAVRDPSFGGDYLREFALNPVPDMVLRPWPTAMTREQLLSMLAKAYGYFYFRPRFVLRTITRLTSIEDTFIKARTGLRLLFSNGLLRRRFRMR